MRDDGENPAAIRRIGHDPTAFETFYRQHVADVGRFLARRVADPQTVADLTADVFLQVIDSAASYQGGPGGPRGWLFGIARNLVAGQRRDSVRADRSHARLAGHRRLEPDDIARVEERVDAARRLADLAPGLTALPAGERAVLELVALDGLTVREAAAVLHIRPGTARVRLYRARHAASVSDLSLVMPTSEVLS